jgi:hypothetical protein
MSSAAPIGSRGGRAIKRVCVGALVVVMASGLLMASPMGVFPEASAGPSAVVASAPRWRSWSQELYALHVALLSPWWGGP